MLFRNRQTSSFILIGALLSSSLTAASPVYADSKPYYTYSLATQPTGLQNGIIQRFGQDSNHAQFGAGLLKGDFNGDTVDDLVITAPYFSSEKLMNRGKIDIYFGKKNFTEQLADPTSKPDISFVGGTDGAQAGTSIAKGDVNKDGIADIIIGVPGEQSVYVVYGRRQPTETPSPVALNGSTASWTIRGRSEDERFGFAVDSGDTNSDGIDDVIVGAPFAPANGMKRAGKVHVIFGKKKLPRKFVYPLDSMPSDMIFSGDTPDNRFGISLAHGDFDADKKLDLAIGSYMATNDTAKQAGTVTVLLGARFNTKLGVNVSSESVRGDNLNISDDPDAILPQNTLLSVDHGFDWFGYSLAVGDLNNDQIDDLVITSFPYLKNAKQGEVYVLWGEKSGKFEDNKPSRIIAPREDSLIGGAVAVSDMNGDGSLDLIIGAPTGAPGSTTKIGRAYILSLFPRNNQVWDFSKIPADLTIEGEDANDWFGNSIAVGDFNDDGNRDLVIGAPNSQKRDSTGQWIMPGSFEYFSGPQFPRGDVSYTVAPPSEFVRRGSFMVQIMKAFKFEERNKEFIDSCMENLEFCFYQFSSQTKFSGLTLTPTLQLYPDVKSTDPYYKAINIGTILNFVHGFTEDSQTPFYPQKTISRIHALKILMSSTGILPWKDYYEFKKELTDNNIGIPEKKNTALDKDPITTQKTPYQDISARIPYMWWYPRYVNFAYLSGIIDDTVFFQPDAPLTQKDFELWMQHIQAYIARHEKSS